jgi:Carboxypeptidase regulatory-like domain
MRVAGALAVVLCSGCGEREPLLQPTTITMPPGPLPRPISVSGTVVDTAHRNLSGARVEVMGGSRAGTVVTTGDNGRFLLPEKLEPPFTFAVTKDGYMSTTRSYSPSFRPPFEAEGVDFWIELSSLGPVVNLSGTYTLTLTADDRACRALPAEARTRTYAATILSTPKPTDFRVTLSGGQFFSRYDSFGGQTAGDFVRFDVYRYIDEPEPAIVEQVQDGAYLAILGAAPTSAEPSGIVAITVPFDGSFDYCPGQVTPTRIAAPATPV